MKLCLGSSLTYSASYHWPYCSPYEKETNIIFYWKTTMWSPVHHVSLHITLFSLITHTTIQPCISVKYRNGSLVQQYMHTFFSKVTSMFATTIFYTQPLQQNWLWSQVPSPTNHLYHNFVVAILNRCHGLPRIHVPKKRLPHWTCTVIRQARKLWTAPHNADHNVTSMIKIKCSWLPALAKNCTRTARTPCGLLRGGKS